MAEMKEKDMHLGMDQPSNRVIYGASLASIALSLLTVRRNPPLASFFGLWAPTILGIGILMKENKLLDQRMRMPAY